MALVAGAALLAWSGPAWAQRAQLQALVDEVAATGMKIRSLLAEYDRDDIVDAPQRFGAKLNDAEMLFLLGDHQRASLLLFDLVENERNRDEPKYPQALYYLAESQYQMGNDIAARSKFNALVESGSRTHLDEAILRLIEIADRARDWTGLDERVDVLRRRGPLPPRIAYIHAKSLLRQGKLDQVAAAAQDVPAGHPLHAKARYLVAVATLQAGDAAGARAIFQGLGRIDDSYEDAEVLRDLSRMNHARILMEQGRLDEAIDAYQDIDRASPYFDQSLYEITWTYVRRADASETEADRLAEYRRALRALEILLLAEPNPTLAPEARILLGNILLRLERFEEASAAFQEVVQRYGPVHAELATLAASAPEPSRYYDEIVERSRAGGGLLPALAVKWAAEQRSLRDALGVVKDIDQSVGWVDESQALIDKLLTMLSSDQRTQFFPALHDAQASLLELDNVLVGLSYRLLAVERDIVEDELSDAQADALEAVLEERARLFPLYEKLPKRREEYEGRLQSMRDRMEDLQKRAFQLKWEVAEMRRSIEGIAQWMSTEGSGMPAASRAELQSRLDHARREVQYLDELQGQLEAEISKERSLITLSTKEQAEEDEIRARYAATLEREREILAAGAASVPGESRAQLAIIAEQRDLLSRYHVDLETFRKRLTALVDEKAYDVKAQLLREQALLEEHAAAVEAARSEARRVVGEIAVDSLRDVQQNFQSIVLRGDVGIVDVAWALKEEKTHQISRRVNEQRKELAILDAEFNAILSE